ncbi:MAG: glutamine amidotransferase [Planctomycetota bacterium]|nr:MAG: glutamine amidotransferase [Planctomycetota bacterium]
MSRAPFLIVRTGTTKDAICVRHGDFAAWIRAAAGWSEAEAVEAAPYLGEEMPPPSGFAGAVLTGSPAMVTERAPWMLALEDWLRRARDASLPLLGICFGHQLLASAFGGRVGDHPRGMELGTVEIELLPAAAEDPLLAGLPERFPAQATHAQSVLEPPPGAVVLARSAYEPCHALRFAPRCWGVQFHPEIGAAVMDGYKECYRSEAQAGRLHIGFLGEPTRESPAAASVLRRFAAGA